jgi:pullulanase/glycogen debranching enzyme
MSWYDWDLAKKHADLIRFVSRLIAFRRAHPILSAERFYSDAEIQWFGSEGGQPDWHGRENRIACLIHEKLGDRSKALYLLFNATLHPLRFTLPAPPAGPWRVAIKQTRRKVHQGIFPMRGTSRHSRMRWSSLGARRWSSYPLRNRDSDDAGNLARCLC